MKANAIPFLNIFGTKSILEVPLFQRQYVWNQETQWEPMWDDISHKFIDYFEDRQDSPVHFFGAMVLDLKQTPTTYVERRQIIDGQQRLTTLQIFLAAFRDFCYDSGNIEHSKESNIYIINTGMMPNPEVDQFKIWPTLSDRQYFMDVITIQSKAEIIKKYPLTYRKRARKPNPRPRIIEAYLFFYEQLSSFFFGNNAEEPIHAELEIKQRIELSFQALKNALYVVVIDLDKIDDAQVIFETLNARGEPLLPADLLRNYIFLRAARKKENQEELYEKYWRRFDADFWRHQVRQGRLFRPRSDLFMQHYLASIQGRDIPIKHLYVEYKYWVEKTEPFEIIEDELKEIAKQGDNFRRMLEPAKKDIIYPLMKFIDCFDIRTPYPFILFLLGKNLPDVEWKSICSIIESYLLRRAVCNLSTKSYNKIFLNMIKQFRNTDVNADVVRKHLSSLYGETAEWPNDIAFKNAWKTAKAYHFMQQNKIVHILNRLNDGYHTKYNEEITYDGFLSIEHILPQTWIDNWPLKNNTKGLTLFELWDENADENLVKMTNERNSILETFGNLTLLTQTLNSSISNSAWEIKKPAILESSLLPINQQLSKYETWDEDSIDERSNALFEKAIKIWEGPNQV